MPRKPVVPGVDRRQQILEAALSVFSEQGFEAATNKEIAERASVNQGLIYFYFESKADVFFAAFDHHAHLVLTQLDAVEQKSNEAPAIGLSHLLRHIVRVLDTPRTLRLLRMMSQVAASREPSGLRSLKDETRSIGILAEHIAIQLREYLEVQMRRSTLRLVNADLVARLMTRTLISSVFSREEGSLAHISHQELVEMMITLYIYGLLPRDTGTDRE